MSIEVKKMKLELIKMDANIMDAEIRIEERLAEIERIKEGIKQYDERREELSLKIEETINE